MSLKRQGRPTGSLGRRRTRASAPVALVTLVLTIMIGSAIAAAYHPAVAARVPFIGALLSAVSHYLPASVAWMHDTGTERLRPGAYFGWSDGTHGELHLYGTGCSTEDEDEAGAISYLALTGPAGRLEIAPNSVTQLWTDLDRARAHPHLRVEVVTNQTLAFDRVALRCRDGTEARARILASVLNVPAASTQWPDRGAPLAVDPLFAGSVRLSADEAPRAIVNGPNSLPGIGQVAEFTLLPAKLPLTLVAIAYAPPQLGTGHVTAAAGHPAALPYWRAEANSASGVSEPHALLPPLTPWHSGYQAPDDPRAFGARQASAIGLSIAPDEAGVLFVHVSAFHATPTPKPLLLKPVLTLEHAGQSGTLVASGLAFGWTRVP